METGHYIICGLLILIGIVGLFAMIYKIQKEAKKELLDELWKNKDITERVYVDYLTKL